MEDFYEKPSRVARNKRLQKKETDVYLVKRRKPKQKKHMYEEDYSSGRSLRLTMSVEKDTSEVITKYRASQASGDEVFYSEWHTDEKKAIKELNQILDDAFGP